MNDPYHQISRRALLGSAGAFIAWANMPGFARAAGRDPRLMVIMLRGAMDGLGTVPAIGDPDFARHRAQLVAAPGGPEAPLPLDGFFVLSGAMPKLHAMYQDKQALIVHACATPYRDRSHFDGQNVLETGYSAPGAASDGWLNRAAAALPRGEKVNPHPGLAVSTNVPLILRGGAPVLTWTPPQLAMAPTDTVVRLHDLYTHVDPELARTFGQGVDLDTLLSGAEMGGKGDARGPEAAFLPVAEGAARILVRDDGPRLGVLDLPGWDTHFGQGAEQGRLPKVLSGLDLALFRIAQILKPVWHETVVMVVTEFGRTVAENGNDGTDHGNATAALLLGGAVKGGRVIADWPGLRDQDLFEGRDLKPTIDVRSVAKGVLRDHLGIDTAVLAEQVFPGSIGVKPYEGLVG
jgi:uncharacterized protein (DUF1501 family)